MKRRHVLALGSVVCGALIWAAIAAASGRNEAWDSSAYYSIGIPAVCVVAIVLAFLEPSRAWQWGVLPMAGQLIALVISQGDGGLLPLGVIVLAVFSIPPIVAAMVAALVAKRRNT